MAGRVTRLFVALNVWGVEMSFHVSVVVTLIALAVLAVFWVGAAPHLDLARWALPLVPGVGADKARGSLTELALRAVALSGHRATSAGGRREPRSETRHAARILYGLVTLIAVSFPDRGAELRASRPERRKWRRRASRCFSDFRRFSDTA